MLDLIKEIFSSNAPAQQSLNHEENLQLAVAVLLLEVAFSDQEFSKSERMQVVKNLKKQFALNESVIQALLERASQEKKEKVELWKYTNKINDTCSHEEKIGLIEALWRIIYDDDVLDAHEDYLVHKIAALLHLSHDEFIQAKLKAKYEK